MSVSETLHPLEPLVMGDTRGTKKHHEDVMVDASESASLVVA